MNRHNPNAPFIKICGLTHQADVDTVSAMGASMLGFIFHSKSPRYISPARAAKIHSSGIKRVGVFVNQSAEEICNTMQEAKLDFAQLHGKQSTDDAQRIGTQRIVRVLWPARHESRDSLQAEIDQWANSCAYYLLDAGTEGGGHGKSIDLEKIKGLEFPKAWILAGGIDAEQLPQILTSCQANGLDLNSKLEFSAGHKSNKLLFNVFSDLHNNAI